MPRYRRLTREQRYTIESMIRNGRSQKEVAAIIGVSESTVSRELRRDGMDRTRYSCKQAEDHARSRPWHGYRVPTGLLEQVEARLRQDWSLEQISRTFARRNIGSVSHETIYQHVYRDKCRGGDLHRHLRHRCKSYRKRGEGRERRGRLKDQVMIDERPRDAPRRPASHDFHKPVPANTETTHDPLSRKIRFPPSRTAPAY